MKDIDIPALIVGVRPVGLPLSLLLARQGIEHAVVERRHGLHASGNPW